jgi:Flp pilus assembly protein TadG
MLFRQTASGATAVEFALLSPVIIALILVPTMVGVMFLAKSELDVATEITARGIMTDTITTSSQIQTSLCANVGYIFNCANFMVNLQSYATLSSMQTTSPTITYNGSGAVTNSWTTNFGSSGSLMVLQVMYQFPVIGGQFFTFSTQSNGSNLMLSTAVFVKE